MMAEEVAYEKEPPVAGLDEVWAEIYEKHCMPGAADKGKAKAKAKKAVEEEEEGPKKKKAKGQGKKEKEAGGGGGGGPKRFGVGRSLLSAFYASTPP